MGARLPAQRRQHRRSHCALHRHPAPHRPRGNRHIQRALSRKAGERGRQAVRDRASRARPRTHHRRRVPLHPRLLQQPRQHSLQALLPGLDTPRRRVRLRRVLLAEHNSQSERLAHRAILCLGRILRRAAALLTLLPARSYQDQARNAPHRAHPRRPVIRPHLQPRRVRRHRVA